MGEYCWDAATAKCGDMTFLHQNCEKEQEDIDMKAEDLSDGKIHLVVQVEQGFTIDKS